MSLRRGWWIGALLGIAAGAAAQDAQVAAGQRIYDATCRYCHAANLTGTRMLELRLGRDRALLELRSDLSGPYIELVVRQGIGSMPWYRYSELTDAELASVVAYLTRNAPPH